MTTTAGAPASQRPAGRRGGRVAVLGPAFVAAVAYLDPGNVATNTSAGVRYGFLLVWVLVVANVVAALVQYLSARLGLVTGETVPELVGRRTRPASRRAYWVQAQVVTVATDLAEVVGGAVALQLLFDLPLMAGALVTAAVSTALLLVQGRTRLGQRRFERVLIGMLAVVGVGFLAGLVVAPPPPAEAVAGLVPRFDGSGSLLLAAGMLGATVMPHAVYLHSALTRDRHGRQADGDLPSALASTRVDIGLAMLLAGTVNIGMLLVAATALAGHSDASTLQGVHAALGEELGSGVALLFALGLLASGLASTTVGGYAGAVVLEGLVRRRVPVAVRRVACLVPALVVLAAGVDPTTALVMSQVVLSFGIPFALVPLVRLNRDPAVVAHRATSRGTAVVAWAVVAVVVALNVGLVVLTVTG